MNPKDRLMCKVGGVDSEYWGQINPVNALLSPVGGLISTMTPSWSEADVEEQDKNPYAGWQNGLIPGLAAYRTGKRMAAYDRARKPIAVIGVKDLPKLAPALVTQSPIGLAFALAALQNIKRKGKGK